METSAKAKVINLNAILDQGSLVGLIDPTTEVLEPLGYQEHAAEPLKRPEDIQAFKDYYRGRQEWRNLLLFICGINFGLRVSDLLRLRWGDLINEDLTWRDEIVILEKKTEHTRKRKANRHIGINDAVKAIGKEYLGYQSARGNEITFDTYLFRDECKFDENKPLHRNSVERLLKRAARDTGIDERVHVSTHTLRKSFAYWQIRNGVSINLLQKILGHNSVTQTLTYAGFTAEDIRDAYQNLNFDSGDKLPQMSEVV